MGVSTKNRRKIVVNNRKFVWYICEEWDWYCYLVLHVISEDKHFNIGYPLGQTDQRRHLIVLGKEFPGLKEAGHCWKSVLCPGWETDDVVTPATVRKLIEWCLDSERELVEVGFTGSVITTS